MSEYKFQVLDVRSIHEIDKLFSAVFSSASNIDLINWKYFINPAGNAICMGVYFEGKLIGSGAMITEVLQVFEKKMTVCKCTDLMIHPDHQRKGLAKKIIGCLREQIEINAPIFSYTLCSKTASIGFIKNGWEKFGAINNYFKPKVFLRMNFLRGKKIESIIKYNEAPVLLENFPFHIDTSKISISKSYAFIKWRIKNPNFNYFMLCSFKNNVIDGYLIYSIGKSNFLNVVDIEAINNEQKIKSKLLCSAEAEALTTGCRGVLICSFENSSLLENIRGKFYWMNPFKKGPLSSVLDLNICIDKQYESKVFDKKNCDIYALNYDDI